MVANDKEKTLAKQVHQALRAWHSQTSTPENLLSHLQIVQVRQAKLNPNNNPTLFRLATNEILLNAIDSLTVQNETAAEILKLRFPADKSLVMVGHQLHVSEHTVSRKQREAIKMLADIIAQQEETFRQEQIQEKEALLPPPSYSQLFGFDTAVTHLTTQLSQPQKPYVVAIVGMGGIGKTALADAVTRHIIRRFCFQEVIWLRATPHTMSGQAASSEQLYEDVIADLARYLFPPTEINPNPQQRLVQVRQRLKSRPCLVIVDNIESAANTALLINHFKDLAQPSKFLLTTRIRSTTLAAVSTQTVNELAFSDAADLMCHHALEIENEAVANASEVEYKQIYDVTGGNPLALKLVVSLLDTLTLHQVLDGMKQGEGGDIEQMYKRIYWQAWQLLSDNGRQLLMSLPLVSGTGGALDYLQTLSGLTQAQILPAIQELRGRSLLEVRGDLQEKRYGIHRLTETFLHTEIIHWPPEDGGD
ncbi:MAG: hypothetical protein GY796_28560 [Chloroflexi bacterium]|nr:hypothetical protein [Chloroflexota bacterium]